MDEQKDSTFFVFLGLILVILVVLGFLTLFTQAIPNSFNLVLNPDYYIPKESNILEFRALISNSKGEWNYAEDSVNFYHNRGTENDLYVIFAKEKVTSCKDFKYDKIETWCIEENNE